MFELVGNGFIAAMLIGFVALGLRILRRAPADDAAPDRLIALFFIAQAVSHGLYRFNDGPPGALGGVFTTLTAIGLLGFTRLVFRPEETWAQALAWFGPAAIAVAFVGPPVLGIENTVTRLVAAIVRSAAFAWPVVECALYYRAMRKRVALGLADPVLSNRFLLWSLWTAGGVALPLAGVVFRLLAVLGVGPDQTIVQDLGNPLTVALAAWSLSWMAIGLGALWLSFFPPEAYADWLRQRAAGRPVISKLEAA